MTLSLIRIEALKFVRQNNGALAALVVYCLKNFAGVPESKDEIWRKRFLH